MRSRSVSILGRKCKKLANWNEEIEIHTHSSFDKYSIIVQTHHNEILLVMCLYYYILIKEQVHISSFQFPSLSYLLPKFDPDRHFIFPTCRLYFMQCTKNVSWIMNE